jgi:hypothetical protein
VALFTMGATMSDAPTDLANSALMQRLLQFVAGLSPQDITDVISGEATMVLARSTVTFPALLATAIDTGDPGDLAIAIKAMRAEGWAGTGQMIAAAYATRVQKPDDVLCSCGHASQMHTPDLGCWMCPCPASRAP